MTPNTDPRAERAAMNCICGTKPLLDIDPANGACFIECVNHRCKLHLTVAAGAVTDATTAWRAAVAALAAREGEGE